MKETREIITAAAKLASVGIDAYRSPGSFLDRLKIMGNAKDAFFSLLTQMKDLPKVGDEFRALLTDPQASGGLVTHCHAEGLALYRKFTL